jgi:outer membrane protein assembly factor BamD (BamD/ComL family)
MDKNRKIICKFDKNQKIQIVSIPMFNDLEAIKQKCDLDNVYNSINGIKSWFTKYPNSKYKEKAKLRLAELVYNKMKENNNNELDYLETFVKKYSYSPYIKEVKETILAIRK